jgi:hypothetical protein
MGPWLNLCIYWKERVEKESEQLYRAPIREENVARKTAL